MKQETVVRLRVTVEGTVQGVGFRPFVFRVAQQLGVAGWVTNSSHGALLELEGPVAVVETFLERMQTEAPAAAKVDRLAVESASPTGETAFGIRTSEGAGVRRLVAPPDLATCADCLRELNDPMDRRFRYPFLTCTQCGPRFSLITDIPYDRANTTMSRFPLCRDCRAEYEDPTNRRFHAEPIACPVCGPRLALWDVQGHEVARDQEALQQACEIIRRGGVLAVKGVGGFQLWVDARSDAAVQRLRLRKTRPEKPFAVLFPSVSAVRESCRLTPEEEGLLLSPEAPIVLLRQREPSGLARSVSPDNPYVGAMVPCSPLHHLLMTELQGPAVATSGNRSDEPIVIDEQEALVRLAGIADAFLVHDRAITRPVDDSVVRVVEGETLILRRARGYVPRSIRVNASLTNGSAMVPILAVGGHLKNTIALTSGDQVMLSQHLGDLSTLEAFEAFRRAVDDLQRLLDVQPQLVACDLHPDYRSTIFAQVFAERHAIPLVRVQHHHAHVAACMAEHNLDGEVLGVVWDGAGYGSDGAIWGGEFLIAGYQGFRRLAHLRPFRLPGGETAMRKPWRSAFSVLWEIYGERRAGEECAARQCVKGETDALLVLLRKGLASPWTTSMGRLFDAVSSLAGLCDEASFEGQAAMALEFAAERYEKTAPGDETGYQFAVTRGEDHQAMWVADWRPLIESLIKERREASSPERIAYRFHLGLADLICRIAEQAALPRVVLTGGCFQNALLLRLVRRRLERVGFIVYSHRLAPPNDGGLSLGQAVVAAHQVENSRSPSISR
ncbi:MAG: carbamoyltransferase HypF [Nitrospira sp.]|nr:MAG: carbamoyltransferase HypF [Nitrospira sp.]